MDESTAVEQLLTRSADIFGMLSFQKLDVYRCAVEFLALSVDLSSRVPRGHACLTEQLRRAALSISLNIAEASGRPSVADSARHHGIARGSAMECAAVLDGMRILRLINRTQHAAGIELLARIVSMLSELCRPSSAPGRPA